jgi:hypothetical protein
MTKDEIASGTLKKYIEIFLRAAIQFASVQCQYPPESKEKPDLLLGIPQKMESPNMFRCAVFTSRPRIAPRFEPLNISCLKGGSPLPPDASDHAHSMTHNFKCQKN